MKGGEYVIMFLFLGVFVVIYTIIPIVYGDNGVPETNAEFTHSGTANKPMSRLCDCVVNPSYESIVENIRNISNMFHDQNGVNIPDERGLSAFVFLWGQFIAHEIVLTQHNDEIYELDVSGDPLFTTNMVFNGTEHTIDTEGCKTPINHVTPFIDGTMVYSYDFEKIKLLRTFKDGLMRVSDGDLPPRDDTTNKMLSGDPRIDENAGLTIIHTLFIREHNYWARRLKMMRRGWSDEQLFWKARQLVIAELQVITYEEWLPALLGPTLKLPKANAILNPNNANIHTEFNTAVFRIGHSMVPAQIGEFSLFDLFTKNEQIISSDKGVEKVINGFLTTKIQKIDSKINNELRNSLFGDFGLDLASANLLRGREIGILKYKDFIQCVFDKTIEDPDDLEIFTGVLSEPHVDGSSVGETIALLFIDHFSRIRDNDKDFYLWNKDNIGGFFYDEIVKTRFSDIIIRTTDLKTQNVQNNVFISL